MSSAAGAGSAEFRLSARVWRFVPRLRHIVICVAASAFLDGCIFLPKTTTDFDSKCQIVTRHVELEAHEMGPIAQCGGGDGCLGVLAVIGAISAGSAVVSGSIAVVGNVVFWLEERGRCMRHA